MEKLLEFKDVKIKLNDKILYNQLNLIIYEGDRYILTGPNGIGKTLLFELITLGMSRELANRYKGLNVSGHIYNKNGNDLLDPEVEDRKISYVSQIADFYKNSTVYSEILAACNGVNLNVDDKKLKKILNDFCMYDKIKSKTKNGLSGGQSKIVQLVSGIMKLPNCNLMLLDEPLNHLSFQNSKTFNDIMLTEISDNPKLSIITISHCRAINFLEKALVYDTKNKTLVINNFSSYDCFEN